MAKEPSNAVYCEIGRRVREHRKAMGRNQGYIADILGVSQRQASNYELGYDRLSVVQIILLSDAFGVSAGYFLDSVAPMILANHFSDAEQNDYVVDLAVAAERKKFDRAYDRLKTPEDRALGLDLLEFAARRGKRKA